MGPAHLAIGLSAKPAAPKVSLLVLLVASEALDLLSFLFIPLGFEDAGISQAGINQGLQVLVPGSIPWSHGLFMALVWSLLFSAVAFLFYKDRRISIIIGLVVFSHWLLDFIVHSADLPLLFEGSPTVGLGLWTSGPGLIFSILLEILLLIGGITVYLLARRRKPAPQLI
ncbi:MAG: hypothetical protein ACWGOY_08135 [Anaerolineales bacterium]